MKRYSFTILLSLLLTPIMAQNYTNFAGVPDVMQVNTKTDLELMGLKGNIKSYCKKNTTFIVRVKRIDYQPISQYPEEYFITFNEKGNILSRIDYQNGKVVKELTKEYDSDGLILKVTVKYISAKDIGVIPSSGTESFTIIQFPPTTTIYSYNKHKKPTEIQIRHTDTNELLTLVSYSYHPSNIMKEVITTYNPGSNNPVIYRKEFNKQGLCVLNVEGKRKTKYKYDKNGNVAESRYYDNYEHCEIITFKYDKNNNVIERRQTYDIPDVEKIYYVQQHEYDKNGLEVKLIDFQENKAGEKTMASEYYFDTEKGLGFYTSSDKKTTRQIAVVKKGENTFYTEEYFKDGKTTLKRELLTNPDGLLLESNVVNYAMANGTVTLKDTYQYDSYGNVIKEERAENNEVKAYKYEIEYY